MSAIRCGRCGQGWFRVNTETSVVVVVCHVANCAYRAEAPTLAEAFAAIQKPSEPVNQQETSK